MRLAPRIRLLAAPLIPPSRGDGLVPSHHLKRGEAAEDQPSSLRRQPHPLWQAVAVSYKRRRRVFVVGDSQLCVSSALSSVENEHRLGKELHRAGYRLSQRRLRLWGDGCRLPRRNAACAARRIAGGRLWIPASAGMTEGKAGMTEEEGAADGGKGEDDGGKGEDDGGKGEDDG